MSHEEKRQPLLNPFSPTAVTKVSESIDMISVEMPSLNEALRYIDAYLQPPARAWPGYVLAVQGDYLSGKTDLAAMLLNHVSEWEQEDPAWRRAQPVYLDAADQFRELYVRFVKGLPENEVYAKIREYYANTVAARLGDEATTQIRSQLRSPDAHLEHISSTLGLSEFGLIRATTVWDFKRNCSSYALSLVAASSHTLYINCFRPPLCGGLKQPARSVRDECAITIRADGNLGVRTGRRRSNKAGSVPAVSYRRHRPGNCRARGLFADCRYFVSTLLTGSTAIRSWRRSRRRPSPTEGSEQQSQSRRRHPDS